MSRLGLAGPLLALAACASAGPPGPDAAALESLIAAARPGSAPRVTDVRCDFIAEEGSEWRCRYRQRASDGRRVPLETFVAMDGGDWVSIDGIPDPDRPPEPR